MQPGRIVRASDAKRLVEGRRDDRREAYVGSRARAHRRHRRGRRTSTWWSVGAGLAGINATEAAARNGAKTVVIGRNTTFSVRGVDVGHIGSKHHKSNGFDLDPRVAARFPPGVAPDHELRPHLRVGVAPGEVFDYIEDLGSRTA
ncbi:MAG: hypothetical protein ACLT98_07070 [Eggerthellaceae bacterium]